MYRPVFFAALALGTSGALVLTAIPAHADTRNGSRTCSSGYAVAVRSTSESSVRHTHTHVAAGGSPTYTSGYTTPYSSSAQYRAESWTVYSPNTLSGASSSCLLSVQ